MKKIKYEKKGILILLLVCVFTFFCQINSWSFSSTDSIPDSAQIRKNLQYKWFEEKLELLRLKKPEVFANEINEYFQVRLEEYDNEFGIIVAPSRKILVDVIREGKTETIETDSFPAEIPGSWILYRDKKSGNPLRIKLFFHSDNDVYVQIRPNGKKTYADFILFHSVVAKDVPIGLSFQQFYGFAFEDIKKLTSSTLPWHLTNINKGMYAAIHQMVAIIRENLERIEYAEDAALDEDGNSVYISTEELRPMQSIENKLELSSAGFAKWIIDGLAFPVAGSSLRIEPLKVPTVEFAAGSLKEGVNTKYNINFALDWTRHLAAASLSITSGKTIKYTPATVDVSVFPFAGVIENDKIIRGPEYVKNAGYHTEILKPLLFILAATEPDYFYLGAIQEGNGKTPEVLYFNEVALFFPWFDDQGHFNVTVFESGVETSLKAFEQRYPENYVHLVRVKASEYFKVQ